MTALRLLIISMVIAIVAAVCLLLLSRFLPLIFHLVLLVVLLAGFAPVAVKVRLELGGTTRDEVPTIAERNEPDDTHSDSLSREHIADAAISGQEAQA
jgi:hypothetical protein